MLGMGKWVCGAAATLLPCGSAGGAGDDASGDDGRLTATPDLGPLPTASAARDAADPPASDQVRRSASPSPAAIGFGATRTSRPGTGRAGASPSTPPGATWAAPSARATHWARASPHCAIASLNGCITWVRAPRARVSHAALPSFTASRDNTRTGTNVSRWMTPTLAPTNRPPTPSATASSRAAAAGHKPRRRAFATAGVAGSVSANAAGSATSGTGPGVAAAAPPSIGFNAAAFRRRGLAGLAAAGSTTACNSNGCAGGVGTGPFIDTEIRLSLVANEAANSASDSTGPNPLSGCSAAAASAADTVPMSAVCDGQSSAVSVGASGRGRSMGAGVAARADRRRRRRTAAAKSSVSLSNCASSVSRSVSRPRREASRSAGPSRPIASASRSSARVGCCSRRAVISAAAADPCHKARPD